MPDPSITLQINGQDNLSRVLKGMESNVIRFVGAISSALTTVTAIGFPVVSSANYQRELLAAAKTTQYNKEQIDELRNSLTELSTTVNVSAVDLAKIATMGGQIGIGENNVGALVSFVDSIAIAVSSLDISAEEAVQSMGKLINIFGLAPSEFNKVVSSLTAVSVASTASADSLFDVVRRIGSLGGSVTLPQAAALSASMIDLGLTAETAGTTITKIFADMKSKAGEFAAVAVKANADATGSLRFTVSEWVDLVKTNGLEALRAYIAGLSQLSTEDSARIKGALTGEGRLFEAVTKMEQQEKRRTVLVKELASAEEYLSSLKKEGAGVEATQAEQGRVDALREAVTQANILDKLLSKANSAYESGTEGIKAQQTVLAGLIAQWEVFKNNIIATGNSIGTVLIPPITGLLRSFSETLKLSDARKELEDAAQGIVNSLGLISSTIAYVRETLREGIGAGTGFNWGSALNLAAIGAAILAFKALRSVMGSIGGAIATQIPGLITLHSKIFGVSEAVKKAREEAAKGTTLQGGWLQTMGPSLREAATGLAKVSAQYSAIEKRNSNLSPKISGALATENIRLANSLSLLERRYGSLDGARAKLDEWYARQAAGGTGLQGHINRLEKQIAAYDATSRVVNNHTAALDRLREKREAVTTEYNRALGVDKFVSLADGISGAIKKVEAFAGAGRLAFNNFLAGWRTASAGGVSSIGTTITDTLKSISAKLNGAATFNLTPLFQGAVSAAGGMILKLTGLSEAYALAGTSAAKFYIGAISGALALGKAIGAVISVLGSAINIVFFAVMAKQVLEMIGLWDTVLKKIQAVYSFFGGSPDNLPNALKTSEQLGKANKEAEAIIDNFKLVTAEASKFTKEVSVTLGLLRSSKQAISDLTFNPENPTKAKESAKQDIEATLIAYSKLGVTMERIKALQTELITLGKEEQKQAMETAFTTFPPFKRKEQEKLDNIRAKITSLTKERGELEGIISGTGGTSKDPYAGIRKGLENLLPAILDSKEAQAIFGAELESGISLWQKYGNAVVAVRLKEIELEKAKADTTSRKGDANSDMAGQLAAIAAETRLTDQLASLKEEVEGYDKAIKAAARSTESMQNTLTAFRSSTDPTALARGFADAQKVYDKLGSKEFQGLNLPKVGEGDLVDTAALIQVKTKLKELYGTWAKLANEEATRAKNFANEAIGEMERRLKEAIAFTTKIDEALARSKDKAKAQKTDRAADAESRQRLRDIQTEQDKERALVEQTFGIQNRQLSELEAGGIRVFDDKMAQYGLEQQALFEVEEKYRRLRELEEDRLNIQKARKGVTDDVAQYDKLIKKVEYYKQRVMEANAIISNSKAPLAEQLGAAQTREDSLNKMRGSYTQLETILERIANVDPIGGELVVQASEVERLKTSLKGVATDIGQVGLAASNKLAPIFSNYESSLSSAASVLGVGIEMDQKRFEQLALSSEAYGKNLNTAAEAVSKLLASTPELGKALADMDKVLTQGLSDVKVTNLPALQQISTAMAQGIVDAIPKAIQAPGVATAASNIIKTTLTGKTESPTVLNNVTVNEESLKAINDAIEGGVKPKLNVTAEIKWRDQTGQLNITYKGEPIVQNARGGPIGRHAEGSYIQGPGSGTSDSILSWLSNGEYVVDAFTTSTFGSSFFAMLQAAARAGNALSFLRRLSLPAFAGGGSVALPRGFAGIANDFKMGSDFAKPRDTMEIHLHGRDGTATIFAERAQANKLVGVLGTYQKVK